MSIQTFRSKDIVQIIPAIISLRLKFYRSEPYLYNGVWKDEEDYLENFSNSKNSIACCLFDRNHIVGFALGLALQDMEKPFAESFLTDSDFLNESIFYLSDFVVLPSYVEKYGDELYQCFENVLKHLNQYTIVEFCEIVKDLNSDYSDDLFLRPSGFVKEKNRPIFLWWKEVGFSVESRHEMRYWKKCIDSKYQ